VKDYRSILAIGLALALAPFLPARAETGNWQTDYKKAQEEAKANHKLLLVDFTGSDWCGWCIKLNKEVFSQPQFKDYATKNLVLLEIDFPRAKEQSDAVKKQNEQLAGQYQIQGFPTIIVLNGEGKKVGELGYMRGGPTAFIAELEKLPKS
jgi:thioredoxin-related protein